MDSLNSDPVSSTNPEKKAQELINEWLKSYFDGGTHEVAGENIAFPDLTKAIYFNQTQLPPEMTSAIIHWQFTDLHPEERMKDQATKLITVDFLSTVYVRTGANASGNTAEFQCRSVAEALRALIQSPERHRLNQAGIHHLRLSRGPVPIFISGYQSRMLVVTGELQYEMAWTAVPPVTPP